MGRRRTTSCPSRRRTYYYRQIYGCFFRDQHGIDSLDKVGVDNITFETDYPHTDSTWPDTKEVATELMEGVPPDVVEKIMRGNASRMLSMDDLAPGVAALLPPQVRRAPGGASGAIHATPPRWADPLAQRRVRARLSTERTSS